MRSPERKKLLIDGMRLGRHARGLRPDFGSSSSFLSEQNRTQSDLAVSLIGHRAGQRVICAGRWLALMGHGHGSQTKAFAAAYPRNDHPGVIVFLAACLPLKVDAEYVGVDLELVLAVDTSGSMSSAELLIQRQGYIAALRHADFAAALAIPRRDGYRLCRVGRAERSERSIVPWTIVSDADVGRAICREPRSGAPPLGIQFGAVGDGHVYFASTPVLRLAFLPLRMHATSSIFRATAPTTSAVRSGRPATGSLQTG